MQNRKKCLLLFFILIGILFISGCSDFLFGTSGTIKITTNPSGAKIFLDGKDTGKTSPCLLKNVSSGNHIVEAIYFNNKYGEMLNVKAYQQTEIDIDLVYQSELTKINVLPSITNITLSLGNTTTINSVTGYYSDNSIKNIPLSSCTYNSSNKTYASVSNNGTVTGISAGAAIITVSYSEKGVTKTDTILVYIRNTPDDTTIEPIPVEPEPEPEPEPDPKPEPDPGADVSYIIWGTAPSVSITLSNSTGGTEQYSNVILPKAYNYNTFNSNFLYISAQNNGSSGTVNVECYYKGDLKDSAHSEGAYVIATASYGVSD